MYFESSKPVIGPEFFDRQREMAELLRTLDILRQGSTSYIALLGWRKIGKTSLLRQFMAAADAPDVVLFEVDCWEKKPTPRTFFQDYLVEAVDATIRRRYAERFQSSIRASLTNETRLLTTLADLRSLGNPALTHASELLLQLRTSAYSDALFTAIADLPEELGQETGLYVVAILDEFQELQDLNRFKAIRENLGDIFAFFRARWQRHRRVNYIIAGSKLSMMREIITQERAPLFQHFTILEVGPFPEADARQLLRQLSTLAGRPIPEELIERTIALVGTHPFYLQVLGSELCKYDIVDEDTFKITLQQTLFDASGRLALYFQDLVGRIVGRSASLEQTLVQLARQPGTLSEVAAQMGIGTGTLKSWIDRVADLVAVVNGIYQIADPCLRLWLSGKSDLRPILPPLVLGDEAEQAVARRMAAAGFELVYQSRASRGALDLLAILQTKEVGVQVKKGAFPYYLSRQERDRMIYWAGQLGWVPLLALVVAEQVCFYEVGQLQVQGESCRIDETTQRVDNLLSL